MSEGNYATDKREIVHRVLSLIVGVSLLVIEVLTSSPYSSFRGLHAMFILPVMFIWFPTVFANRITDEDDAKYVRFFGWALLLGVPLLVYLLDFLNG